jgi:hypothetical protein
MLFASGSIIIDPTTKNRNVSPGEETKVSTPLHCEALWLSSPACATVNCALSLVRVTPLLWLAAQCTALVPVDPLVHAHGCLPAAELRPRWLLQGGMAGPRPAGE